MYVDIDLHVYHGLPLLRSSALAQAAALARMHVQVRPAPCLVQQLMSHRHCQQ